MSYTVRLISEEGKQEDGLFVTYDIFIHVNKRPYRKKKLTNLARYFLLYKIIMNLIFGNKDCCILNYTYIYLCNMFLAVSNKFKWMYSHSME